MDTTKTWFGYYHTKISGFFIIVINLFIIIPVMCLPGWLLGGSMQKQHNEIIGLLTIGIAGVSIWVMLKIFYTKHKTILTLVSNTLSFRDKVLTLEEANLTFGRYGAHNSGSQGSILYIINGKQTLKIAILNYTVENANLYTADWTDSADFYMNEKSFKDFYSFLLNQGIKVVQANDFNTFESVFELRGSVSTGKTLLQYYILIALLIGIMLILEFFILPRLKKDLHDPILVIVIGLSFVFIFYNIIKKWVKGRGLYMTVQPGLIRFLHSKTKQEIFSTSVSNVNITLYLAKYLGKFGFETYQELKLKVPGFEKITIGVYGIAHQFNPPLKKRIILFPTRPDYIVDYITWKKIVDAFEVDIF